MSERVSLLRIYCTALIILASPILILTLFGARAARIYQTNATFFSIEFVALLLLALGLAIISVLVAGRFRLQRLLTNQAAWSWLWLVGSTLGLIAASQLEFFQPYRAPFVFWLMLVNSALLLALAAPIAARFDYSKAAYRILLIILIILLPALLLEAGLRFWFSNFGSTSEKVAYLYTAHEIVSLNSPLQGLPYINYGLSPTFEGHNERGYRGAEIASPKPENVYRIFALGGSTTYGVDLDWQDSYPAQLQRILRNEYGYRGVEVINAGVVAYSSYDSLANFIFHVLDDQPDMIILYHAINDVLARLVDPRHYSGLNPARGLWSLDGRELPSSTLIRFLSVNTGLITNPNALNWYFNNVAAIEHCSDLAFCESFDKTPQEVLDANPPIYFERNYRNLIAVAQSNNVAVFLSSWAYFPEPLPGGDYMTYEFVQNGVNEHNAITRQLAQEYRLPFYDFAAAIPYDASLWLDGLHLNAAGTAEQARQYATFLVENDLLPDWAKSN